MGERRIHVIVENPDRVASGVATMTLDGAKLESNRICVNPKTVGTHEVHVRLGSSALGRQEQQLLASGG